jgi:hypothetical protein
MSNQDTTEPFVLNDEDMDKWIKYKDKIKIMDKWINEMSKKKYENMFKELDLHEITEKHKNIFKKSKDQKISLKTRLSYYLSTDGRRLIG